VNGDRLRLLHIRDAIAKIRGYVTTRAEFLEDVKTQDAVVRNLEVIGEAVKALSNETRVSAPGVRWSSIAGMRDQLIHGYFSVDLDLVWDAIEHDLDVLEKTVGTLLGPDSELAT
jgi:uncharacterized protein with HEPN domain